MILKLSNKDGSEIQLIYEALNATKQKKYKIAEQRYKSVLDKNPKNIFALNNLANIYKSKKEWDNANDCIEKIRKYHPKEPYARGLKLSYETAKKQLKTYHKFYEFYFSKRFIIILIIIFAFFSFIYNYYNIFIITFNEIILKGYPLIGIYLFFNFLSKFAIDIALFSIPLIIIYIDLRKNFKKKLQSLNSLKEFILQIRKDIIKAMEEDKEIYEINSLNIDPVLINEMKKIMRSFSFEEAEIFNEDLKRKMLSRIDIFLTEIIKEINKHDRGKEWASLKNYPEMEYYLEVMGKKSPNVKEDREYLKKKFIHNVMYAIGFILFYEKGGDNMFIYICEVDKYYQK